MKKCKGFVMRSVCGERFIIAEGEANIDFSDIIALNETSAFLWEAAGDEPFTVESLTDALCNEYDVTREQALHDVKELLDSMMSAGIISE